MNTKNTLQLTVAIVLIAALSRLLPHPANFTPMVATCLFGGAYLHNRKMALLLPLGAMLLGDICLHISYLLGIREYAGLHAYMPFVYGALAAITIIGMWLHNNVRAWKIPFAAIGGSLLFFAVSNFGVWVMDFPHTYAGFLQCFAQAVPFYRDNMTWLGDLVYTATLFGAFEWIVRRQTKNILATPN